MRVFFLLALLACALFAVSHSASDAEYLVGVGIGDITPEVAEVAFVGYAGV